MLGDDFFIGRKSELAFLEKLYNSKSFEMLILHGRRRGAKSSFYFKIEIFFH